MSSSPEAHSSSFSIVYNLVGPLLATILTYFFIFLLQDMLMLDFLFVDLFSTSVGFVVLLAGMVVIGWFLPLAPSNEQANEDALSTGVD